MKAQDMYLGVLFSMEDLSVYGYMTNTKIKFIIVLTVPDVIIKDLDMKNVRRGSLLYDRDDVYGQYPFTYSLLQIQKKTDLPQDPHSIRKPCQQPVL
jgi:hypothetical protein